MDGSMYVAGGVLSNEATEEDPYPQFAGIERYPTSTLPPEPPVEPQPDVPADQPPDVGPDVGPDVSPDVTPDFITDLVSDAVTDARPDVREDAQPDAGGGGEDDGCGCTATSLQVAEPASCSSA